MKLVITVKMLPESKEELTHTFPSLVKEVQNHFKELAKESILGPIEAVTVRFLVDCDVIGNSEQEASHAGETH